jgi:hypothetical protein
VKTKLAKLEALCIMALDLIDRARDDETIPIAIRVASVKTEIGLRELQLSILKENLNQ